MLMYCNGQSGRHSNINFDCPRYSCESEDGRTFQVQTLEQYPKQNS